MHKICDLENTLRTHKGQSAFVYVIKLMFEFLRLQNPERKPEFEGDTINTGIGKRDPMSEDHTPKDWGPEDPGLWSTYCCDRNATTSNLCQCSKPKLTVSHCKYTIHIAIQRNDIIQSRLCYFTYPLASFSCSSLCKKCKYSPRGGHYH